MPRGVFSNPKERAIKISNANKGRKFTKEHKQKISEAKKGKTSPSKGLKRTQETLKRMSEAQKGRTVTEETRQKLSKSNKGKNKGEKNQNWKGDNVQKNAGHKRAQTLFSLKPCAICGTDENIERHHIDENTLNNDEFNIRFLCVKHHNLFTKSPPSIEQKLEKIAWISLRKPLFYGIMLALHHYNFIIKLGGFYGFYNVCLRLWKFRKIRK